MAVRLKQSNELGLVSICEMVMWSPGRTSIIRIAKIDPGFPPNEDY